MPEPAPELVPALVPELVPEPVCEVDPPEVVCATTQAAEISRISVRSKVFFMEPPRLYFIRPKRVVVIVARTLLETGRRRRLPPELQWLRAAGESWEISCQGDKYRHIV